MAYFQVMSSTRADRFVLVILFSYFGSVCSEKESKKPDFMLCRQCGHSIVDGREVVDIKSSLALKYKNASVLGPKGILVQMFENPHGMKFDVITASEANILESGEAHVEDSWFPGYAWKLAGCPRCQAHLGWTFTSTDDDDEEEDEAEEDYYDIGDDMDNVDHDMDNEKPADKYKKPKQYSFVGLILSRLIRESFADSLIITPKIYQS